MSVIFSTPDAAAAPCRKGLRAAVMLFLWLRREIWQYLYGFCLDRSEKMQNFAKIKKRRFIDIGILKHIKSNINFITKVL